MTDVYLCHPRRSAIGRFGGTLANVARMSALLAGLPTSVPGTTLNRLCGSGMDAVGTAFRAIRAGEMDLVLAGGVESMSRAPYVMGKAHSAFSRGQKIEDTTIGWRFVNPLMKKQYGIDSMPETAENVAEQYKVSREDQDLFAFRSQEKKLASLPTPFRDGGSVTAGNASGVNDGAAAMLVASESAVKAHGLKPMARVLGMATAGVEPRIMGIGPVPAVRKLLEKQGIGIDELDVIELNEAFAAQGLAVLRELGIADDDKRVNPNGGAIALGHPLGMSGARLLMTATHQLQRTGGRYALCTMCVGVGQGIATLIERV